MPYNPLNLRNPKAGAGFIGAAGPLSNLLLALVFGVFIRVLISVAIPGPISALVILFQIIVLINIALAIFNLIPIPPLDGSNILFALLPDRFYELRGFLTRYGFYILLFLIAFRGLNFMIPIIRNLFRLITGTDLIF